MNKGKFKILLKDALIVDLSDKYSALGGLLRSIIISVCKDVINSHIRDAVRKELELIMWQEFFDDKKVGYLIEYDGLEYECGGDVGLLGGRRKLLLKVGNQEKEVIIDWGTPLDMKFVRA